MLAEAFRKLSSTSFIDAPSDGNQYARQDGTQTEVSTTSGGVLTVSGDGVDNTDPQNPILNRGYRVYTALLNQSGNNPPTVTLLENTTNLTPVFKYSSAGQYVMELGQFIPKDKITLTIGQPRFTSTVGQSATISYEFVDDNANLGLYEILTKLTINSTGITTFQNYCLHRTPIEIKIYS